jgi:inhibitor of KinA sporulation pathway (predicted exonuclease)
MARKPETLPRASHWLVVDLEATCDRRGFPRDQMETIEIGAVLVEAEYLQPVAEFQTFVRPVVRPWLTAFCTELTSITQDDVDGAPVFAEAMADWRRWLRRHAGRSFVFCSWGRYDRNQLRQDAARAGCDLPTGRHHVDLKTRFADVMGIRRCGMARALSMCGLPLEGTHHRGIDDARNIAKILPYALGPIPSADRRSAASRR